MQRCVAHGMAICLIACILLAACRTSGGGGDKGNAANPGARSSIPSDTAGCKHYRACDLLTLADINKALGVNITTPGSDMDVGVAPNIGVNCTYMGPPLVGLTLGCNAQGGNDPAHYAATKPKGSPSLGVPEPVVTPVSGLGDEQAWWAVYKPPPGPMKDFQYHIMVYFGAGGNFFVAFYMPEGSKIDPLTAGKQMAEIVLSRL
jgi:hypothetical protein